jgi:3-hydroxymyristoyl/3-hydroxydecanoyl-(acyl carrier protein) dehydratase
MSAVVDGGSAATWTVPVDLPAFAGHFPGRPIVPGVILLDRVLDLIAAGHGVGGGVAGWSIANAKFLSPVGPGETLTFTWRTRPGGAIEFAIASAGRPVASGLLAAPAAT